METKLRCGFTTGTCAAAAAKAAAVLLFRGKNTEKVEVAMPSGIKADIPVQKWKNGKNKAGCGVKKDAGDDPDVTDGAVVWAFVMKLKASVPKESWYEDKNFPGIFLTGGEGIGIVTKPGLSCPVGKYAINPVPRRMIFQAVYEVKEETGEEGPLLVQIEIPKGRALAEKTFNPKLGIQGGLSVLGTTGIVKPMSDEALIASIDLEIHMKWVNGCRYLILSPGNYGAEFLKTHMGISLEEGVQCSNFLAGSVKTAAKEGFERGLLVGHAGKLVKAAGGAENTHSKYGDRRMEIIAACLSELALDKGDISEKILSCNTTEEAIGILEDKGLKDIVGNRLAKKVRDQIRLWTEGKLTMDVIIFSNERGVFGKAGEVRI